MSIKVTKDNFESEVVQSNVPVLIDFWAAWCGPCKTIGPRVDELAVEVGDKAKICKVNVDEEMALAQKFGIMSIPTLVIFKDGKEANRVVGVRSKDELRGLLGV
jgi:thioredoxin 1